jgi:hypothetical protein
MQQDDLHSIYCIDKCKINDAMNEIEDRLWLGRWPTVESIISGGFTHVVTLHDWKKGNIPDNIKQFFISVNTKCEDQEYIDQMIYAKALREALYDSSPRSAEDRQEMSRISDEIFSTSPKSMSDQYAKAAFFIQEALQGGGKVLVHCFCGISRSPSMIIFYLMEKYDWDWTTAEDFLKKKRTCVDPSYCFRRMVVRYHRFRKFGQDYSNPYFYEMDEAKYHKDKELVEVYSKAQEFFELSRIESAIIGSRVEDRKVYVHIKKDAVDYNRIKSLVESIYPAAIICDR